MMTMNAHQPLHLDQRYLVVGLGLTGYSVACYLLQRGYDCVVQDDRECPPYVNKLKQKFPAAKIETVDLSKLDPNRFDCLVVSPGLSVRSEFIKKVAESGKRIIGDIELFAEAADKPVLAITGSNGKSTVTSLLGEMIKADNRKVGVGGNIGVPALDLLQQDVDYYVVELSSFQLETTSSLRPFASTVLNVSEDHMDRYDDLTDYQQTKQRIYRNAQHHISNADDVLSQCDEKDIRFSVLDRSAVYSIVYQPEPCLSVEGECWLPASELKLKGRHNWANCLAAMAMANTLGVSQQAIVKALKTYAGLEHRSQWVAEINGVSWINDSKGTNPGATKAAIEGLDAPVVLIAGGQSKGADVSVLCDSLKRHVKAVIVMGEDAALLQKNWEHCASIILVKNMLEAVARARDLAEPGDIVLLSPACASFDQYPGFAYRGQHFCDLVRAML